MHGSRRGRDVAFVSEKGLTKFVFCILKQASSVEFDCLIVERGCALFRGGGLCAAKAARRAQCCWHDNSLSERVETDQQTLSPFIRIGQTRYRRGPY